MTQVVVLYRVRFKLANSIRTIERLSPQGHLLRPSSSGWRWFPDPGNQSLAEELHKLNVGLAAGSVELVENAGKLSGALQRMKLLLQTLKSNKVAIT